MRPKVYCLLDNLVAARNIVDLGPAGRAKFQKLAVMQGFFLFPVPPTCPLATIARIMKVQHASRLGPIRTLTRLQSVRFTTSLDQGRRTIDVRFGSYMDAPGLPSGRLVMTGR